MSSRVVCLVYKPTISRPGVAALTSVALFSCEQITKDLPRIEKSACKQARAKLKDVSTRCPVQPVQLVIGNLKRDLTQTSFILGPLGTFSTIEDFLDLERDIPIKRLFPSPAGEA
ncbi:MAG TPA: hypothetical protein VMU07_00270 [Candidatus Paceibacterota bacterium]|nr:hypothetical protein [Candidatus Paceibacterota bacterium]